MLKRGKLAYSSVVESACSDENLTLAGCWQWKVGAIAVVDDFHEVCKQVARRFPYTTDQFTTEPVPSAQLATPSYSFPAAFTDSNKVSGYAKVYTLCRSAKRCQGIGVVDYLVDCLERAFEEWTQSNLTDVGLAISSDETGPIGMSRGMSSASSGNLSPRGESSFEEELQDLTPMIERVQFSDLAMFSRRYFAVKKACKLQFLYIDHNCKDAVQVLMRKVLRNHVQSGNNDRILCAHLERKFSEWIQSAVLDGDFTVAKDPTGPSDLISFLDDLWLHGIANSFCRRAEELLKSFASQLATTAATFDSAPCYQDPTSSMAATSATAVDNPEQSAKRLIGLHDTLRRGEVVLVGFLGMDPSREACRDRVNRCLSILFDTAAHSGAVQSLIASCGGKLFVSAAILEHNANPFTGPLKEQRPIPGATEMLDEVVRGLCSTHMSFVDAICEQMEASIYTYLEAATIVQEGETADEYYLRFYSIFSETLARSYNYFVALEVPADSAFFTSITLVFKRYVDSQELICVPAFAAALHDMIRRLASAAVEDEESLIEGRPSFKSASAIASVLDPLARLVSFLGPKDLFIEAFLQSLAADAMLPTEGRGSTGGMVKSSKAAVLSEKQAELELQFYNEALTILSNSVATSLCSAPLALLRDLRTAVQNTSSVAHMLPFSCTLSSLCIARWKQFCFSQLVVKTEHLAAKGSPFGFIGASFGKAAEVLVSCDSRVLTWVLHAGSAVVECRFASPAHPIVLTTTPCYAVLLGILDGLVLAAQSGSVSKESLVAACPFIPSDIALRFIDAFTSIGFIELVPNSKVGQQATIRYVRNYRGQQGRKPKIFLHTEDLAAAVVSSVSRPSTQVPATSMISIGQAPSLASAFSDANELLASNNVPENGSFDPNSPLRSVTATTASFPDSQPSSNSNRIAASDRVVAFRMRAMEAFIVRIMKETHLLSHEALMDQTMREVSRVGPVTVTQFKQCIQELIARDYIRREGEGSYAYVA